MAIAKNSEVEALLRDVEQDPHFKDLRLKRVIKKTIKAFPQEDPFSEEWIMDEGVLPHYLCVDEEDSRMCKVFSNGELRAAVWHEYGRANPTLRTIAAKHKELQRHKPKALSPDELAQLPSWFRSPLSRKPRAYDELCGTVRAFDRKFDPPKELTIPAPYPQWVRCWPWPEIWQSKSFPDKHWIQLSEKEKAPILFHLKMTEPAQKPIPVVDVRDLYSLGIGQSRADARNPDLCVQCILSDGIERIEEAVKRRTPMPVRIKFRNGFEYIMVVADQFQDVTTNAKQFAAMLRANGFDRDGRGGLSKTKELKTALRDLAATWLCSTKGVEGAIDWTADKSHRVLNKYNQIIPFHGSKKREIKPLYRHARQWNKAKSRAARMAGDIFDFRERDSSENLSKRI